MLRFERRIKRPYLNERRRTVNHYGKESAKNETQLYVSNLPETTSKKAFFKIFANCDDLVGHRMIMKDNKCLGFGFATFKTKEAAAKAIEMLHGKHRLPNGKFLHARIAQQNTVYVKNLHADINWRKLIHLFANEGAINYASVIMHERGFNRGYSSGRGIVCFCTSISASNAIANMNGQIVYGKPIRVEYCKSKYELKKEMYHTYFNREGPRTSTTRSCTNPVSGEPPQPAVVSKCDLPSKLDDMPAMKQKLADQLSSFVLLTQPRSYEQITEILLEYDNDRLEMFVQQPILLQRKVEEVASLITIAALRD